MKRILALDTSTRWGGVALVESGGTDTEVIAEIGFGVRDSHAEQLLPAIEGLLAAAGWSKHDLDAYAATRGPGSFTGIRVGLGTLVGLGLATGRPCFGVTTLEALVEAHGPDDRERVPLIGAGRGDAYAARFDASGSPPVEREPPTVAPEAELLALYAAEAVRLIPAPGSSPGFCAGAPAALCARPPRGIAAAAGRLVALGHPALAAPTMPLAPVYVRPPDVRFPRRR